LRLGARLFSGENSIAKFASKQKKAESDLKY
jgi:hypothetical protein